MIVIVTNRQDYTADFLIIELQRRKVGYVRFNTEDYPQRVGVVWHMADGRLDGRFLFPKAQVEFADIQSIWYRRPVPAIPSPSVEDPVAYDFALAESQAAIDGIWSTLDCYWVSHPENLRRAEVKLYQLKVAEHTGLRVWPTLLTNIPDAARAFYHNQGETIIFKPLRRGRLVRDGQVSLIYSTPVGPAESASLDDVVYAPSLLQTYVPKRVEIRVTVIGMKAFAVAIHSQEQDAAQHDWRRGDTACLRHEPHSLPPEVEARCIGLVKTLGLAFGAIDLILTPQGEYVFLEINPNGQWAWIQQLLPEIPLRETLADLLISGGRSQEN